MKKKIIIKSKSEMENLAKLISESLEGGEIISLRGDLGAGKTYFTKFIGKYLGVQENIVSPTFAILNIYEGKFKIFHFDVYRLGGEEEFSDLGFEEYLYGKGISIIEWADRISEILPEYAIDIEIKSTGEEARIVNISSENADLMKKLEDFNENIGD